MVMITIKILLALVSILTGGAILKKYIEGNKVAVFLAGMVTLFSAVYLFIEVKGDIVELKTTKEVKSKWISPKESFCKTKAGTVSTDGLCKTDAKNAQLMCKAMGGRLPTKEELKRVLNDCEGVVDAYNENIKNTLYQSCYKNKGFSPSYYSYYWTSSTVLGRKDYVWVVNFDHGRINGRNKTKQSFVRCMRYLE